MFAGQYYDSEIKQYYMRARQYDPYICRFTSRDPAESCFKEPMTLHKYLYCNNDPINQYDPSGEIARYFANVLYGIHSYHSMLVYTLENAGSPSELMVQALRTNRWRELWFDEENLRTSPTGLIWMAEPALRAVIVSSDAFEKAMEQVLKGCDYGELGRCLAKQFSKELMINAIGMSACALCTGDVIVPDPIPLLDEGVLCGACGLYSIYKSNRVVKALSDVKTSVDIGLCFMEHCGQ